MTVPWHCRLGTPSGNDTPASMQTEDARHVHHTHMPSSHPHNARTWLLHESNRRECGSCGLLMCCMTRRSAHQFKKRSLQNIQQEQAGVHPICAVDLHTIKASRYGIGCCLAEFFNQLHRDPSRSARSYPYVLSKYYLFDHTSYQHISGRNSGLQMMYLEV